MEVILMTGRAYCPMGGSMNKVDTLDKEIIHNLGRTAQNFIMDS
jgi:hypothetical protein